MSRASGPICCLPPDFKLPVRVAAQLQLEIALLDCSSAAKPPTLALEALQQAVSALRAAYRLGDLRVLLAELAYIEQLRRGGKTDAATALVEPLKHSLRGAVVPGSELLQRLR